MAKNMAGICECNKKTCGSLLGELAVMGRAAMNCRATYIAINFLTTSATNIFSITTLLYGISAYILLCHLITPLPYIFCLCFLFLFLSFLYSFCLLKVPSFLQCHLPYCSSAADLPANSVKIFFLCWSA